jgi:hypothetical protein
MKGNSKEQKEGTMNRGMKFLLILLATTAPAIGCPTCVGRITKNSKPFFSSDFYTVHKSMDHLYQAINGRSETNKKEDIKPSPERVATNSAAQSPVHKK